MQIINKNQDEALAALEKLQNRKVREAFLKAQPLTNRNLADMYTVDIIQVQEQIAHLFNLYAKIKGIENAEICSKIENGVFLGNQVAIKRFRNNIFKGVK